MYIVISNTAMIKNTDSRVGMGFTSMCEWQLSRRWTEWTTKGT